MTKPLLAAKEPLENFYDPAKPLGGSSATIGNFLAPLISNILIVIGIAAFVSILISGFNYISASGDKAKIEQSSRTLLYSLLGLVLAVGAYLLTKIAGSLVGFDFFSPGI
ncbi:hypothetical protein HY333_01595 [Candidatus Collierbacteria bacterium]|nr:hypothetical protein [Candidatus Collierbacteria bacterium]